MAKIYPKTPVKIKHVMNHSLNRILLVEDDVDIQVITKMALETTGGFTVQVCSSGKEAIEKAPVFKPDIILLDVMMPQMDGPAVLKALREIPEVQSVPIVFLTARSQVREVERLKKMDVVDIILKPFDPMTIAKRIKSLWDRL